MSFFDLNTLQFSDADIGDATEFIATEKKSISHQQTIQEVDKIAEKIASFSNENISAVIIEGHKEIEFLLIVLACLKLKIAFVPIEKNWPEQRKQNIKKQITNCLHIITDTKQWMFIKNSPANSTTLPNATAYVLFTSGTSGEPKGVCISRQALLHLNKCLAETFTKETILCAVNTSLFVFDIFLFEFLLCLRYGTRLILLDETHYSNIDNAVQYLIKNKSQLINCTPSFMRMLLFHPLFSAQNLTDLRTIVLMGEKFGEELLNPFIEKFPNIEVYNGYGPTEATVICSLKKLEFPLRGQVSAGKPLGEMQFSIENHEKIGELIISGPQVYSAYLMEGKLHFQQSDNYHTGDIFEEKNGDWYYHTRKDRQIKWHGFRIEPAEIDQVLIRNKLVQNAYTTLYRKENNYSRLICFYIPNKEVTVFEIRKCLKENLPEYMQNIEFIPVPEIPLTTNHKTDEKQLISQYLSNYLSR